MQARMMTVDGRRLHQGLGIDDGGVNRCWMKLALERHPRGDCSVTRFLDGRRDTHELTDDYTLVRLFRWTEPSRERLHRPRV